MQVRELISRRPRRRWSEMKETRENKLRINCIRRNTIIHKPQDYSYIPTDTRSPLSIYSTNSVSSAIFHIHILICISLDSLQTEARRQADRQRKQVKTSSGIQRLFSDDKGDDDKGRHVNLCHSQEEE